LSDLIVFGKLAGEYASAYARANGQPRIDEAAAVSAITEALAPFERGAEGENPYNVQQDLQDAMQKLVGIVRNEPEMREALNKIQDLKQRAARLGAEGHREYHSGWHTSIDVGNLLAVSEAITRSALTRKESRGGHFREDYPDKAPDFGPFNIVVKQGRDGSMQVSSVPIPPLPD